MRWLHCHCEPRHHHFKKVFQAVGAMIVVLLSTAKCSMRAWDTQNCTFGLVGMACCFASAVRGPSLPWDACRQNVNLDTSSVKKRRLQTPHWQGQLLGPCSSKIIHTVGQSAMLVACRRRQKCQVTEQTLQNSQTQHAYCQRKTKGQNRFGTFSHFFRISFTLFHTFAHIF